MSEEYPADPYTLPGGFRLDAFIPIVILSIGFTVLLGWEIYLTHSQIDDLDKAITRQLPQVTQAEKVTDGVSKLVTDLLEASQTDSGAKQIVDKYGIKAAGGDASSSTASGL